MNFSTYHRDDAELPSERAVTDDALRLLSPAAAPAELALRVRLALSHERVRASRRVSGRLRHQLQTFVENTVRPFAMQFAVAGVALVALLGGGLMLGTVAPQQMVEANDAPLSGFSAPQFLYSVAGDQMISSTGDEPLMVQARVDRNGRVYDYRVLSGTMDMAGEAALRQRMLTGVFQPAQAFGVPTRGTVVLTFTDVVVHG